MLSSSSGGGLVAAAENDKEEELAKKKCFLCRAECDNVCQHCNSVKYCSQEHLKLHRVQIDDKENDPNGSGWICFPYEAAYREGIGRVLVATRHIRPMELLLVDPGTCTGPNYSSKPVCLECLKFVNGSITCPRCEYPMCSAECLTKNDRHTRQECDILSRCLASERPDILQWRRRARTGDDDVTTTDDVTSITNAYAVVTPLRMLLMQQENKDEWKRSDQLMDHVKERLDNREEWEWYENHIVSYFKNQLRLNFTSEQIHRAIGLLNVNAVKLQFPKSTSINQESCLSTSNPVIESRLQPEGKGLYPIFAIMSHYCVCNARYTINPKTMAMYVRSRVAIAKGQEISVQYLSALYGNFKRRKMIREQWYFDCMCRRCKDPTECGSLVSALKCDACVSGDVLPLDSLDPGSDWQCQRCGHTCTQGFVEGLVDSIEEELNGITATSGDFDKYADFIEVYADSILSRHHYLIMIATRNLIQFYTYSNEDLPTETLRKKHELCRNFANVLSKIDPGFSEIRTFILRELHFSKLLLSQRDLASGRISRDEYMATSRQSLTALNEVDKHKRMLTQFICG